MKTAVETIAALTEIPRFTPTSIAKLMCRHNINEKALAIFLNVTPKTVRLWMNGEQTPCGLSRRLLQFFDICPEIIDQVVKSIVTDPCSGK
jgi:DNA-binding transcriptional regulator YiaG